MSEPERRLRDGLELERKGEPVIGIIVWFSRPAGDIHNSWQAVTLYPLYPPRARRPENHRRVYSPSGVTPVVGVVVDQHVLREEVDVVVVGVLGPHESVAVHVSLAVPGVLCAADAANILPSI